MSVDLPERAQESINGHILVNGYACGELLVSDVGISFWGGIDPNNGDIIDEHHPLIGQNVTGKVLVLPSGRGSCSGSGALLELILNERAPAALIFTEAEDILTLGVLVAEAMFNRTLPVLRISSAKLTHLSTGDYVQVSQNTIQQASQTEHASKTSIPTSYSEFGFDLSTNGIALSTFDQQLLDGKHGEAAQMAMRILLQIATIQGANKLIDVSQAHIDACIYHGPSSLAFAQELVKRNAKVRIPTTLNSISIDERRWREHGVKEDLGKPASQLGYAFLEMGARATYTCAPYLLNSAPVYGEQIVWAESNAVMFANSVIGARTQKYPDFLDIFIALTGRAPASGSHLDTGRHPTVAIEVDPINSPDDSFWPLLGYHIGLMAANDLPMIYGVEALRPSMDDLKAFSAAFATTSSSSMFHMQGITPEASAADTLCKENVLFDHRSKVTLQHLLSSYQELNTAKSPTVDMICLGNPHLSITECRQLAKLCAGRTKHANTRLLITLGREVHEDAIEQGYIKSLETFGAEFITDTCWCMITEPVIPVNAKNLMTNSGKYAHYGPALVKCDMHFGSLSSCVDAACSATVSSAIPSWLAD